MTARVFIPHGAFPSVVAVIECLAHAGAEVVVGDHDHLALARFSRHVSAFALLPPPAADPAKFARAVEAAARHHRASVVLPIFDEGIMLAPFARRWRGLSLPLPSFEMAVTLADKHAGLQLAARAGLATAPTESAAEAAEALLDRLGLPLVVKPRLSAAGMGVFVATTRAELFAHLERLHDRGAHVAQRWCGRQQIVFQGAFDQGRCIAAHAYRVLSRHPPEHGFGVVLESVLDEPILEQGIRLGERLGYDGPLGIDFLHDTGLAPRAVEVNPRLVLGVVNAIDSGVLLPLALLDAGAPPRRALRARSPGYRAGVRTVLWPSRAAVAATGMGLARQLRVSRIVRSGDPCLLAAFLAIVALHRTRGGLDARSALGERTLTFDVMRKLPGRSSDVDVVRGKIS